MGVSIMTTTVDVYKRQSVGNREVFISRVVGVPGDTLMLNDELWVTDEQVLSPVSYTHLD